MRKAIVADRAAPPLRIVKCLLWVNHVVSTDVRATSAVPPTTDIRLTVWAEKCQQQTFERTAQLVEKRQKQQPQLPKLHRRPRWRRRKV
jgi:hypothetical protein